VVLSLPGSAAYRCGMAQHIIPFRGKRHSGPINQNLLWRDGSVYLMDNHRAALWCWQQEIDLYQTQHSILHIDRHTDCLGANLAAHLAAMPNLQGLPIADYLNATVMLGGNAVPLFRWDNYLSIHLDRFGPQVDIIRSVDHAEGDAPNHRATIRSRPDEVPPNILYWLQDHRSPWIINIDLDYFFCETDADWVPMFSDAFIDALFADIKTAMDEGRVGVVTLCLTPSDFTPGWDECLALSTRIFKILGAAHPQL